MKIQQIRNATLKIKYHNKTILTDPVLLPKHGIESFAGKERNPTVDLPFEAKEVINGIDMVLASHLHMDHFDDAARKMLPKDISIFCQPGDEKRLAADGFTSVTPVEETITWENITITRTGGHHGTGQWEKDLGNVSGFVLKAANEPVLYWAGDTIFCKEVETAIESHSPDIFLTHSCGAELGDSGPIIMDAQQTVKTCKAAQGAIVIATHMEALDHGTVTRDELRKIANENNISQNRLLIPLDGEMLEFN